MANNSLDRWKAAISALHKSQRRGRARRRDPEITGLVIPAPPQPRVVTDRKGRRHGPDGRFLARIDEEEEERGQHID